MMLCAAALLAPGCRCVDDAPRGGSKGTAASTTSTASGKGPPPLPRGRPRARGVIQLIFSAVDPAASRGGDKRRLGCQLHLLDVGGVPVVHANLGTTQRRSFFVKRKDYWRLPARFDYLGPKPPQRIALHTTIAGVHGVEVRLKTGGLFKHTFRPSSGRLPARWGFACVLRRDGGAGAVIEGTVLRGKPRISGTRRATAAQLTPAAMRDWLGRLSGSPKRQR